MSSLHQIGMRAAASLDAGVDTDTDVILAGVARRKKRVRTQRAVIATMTSVLVVLLVGFFGLRAFNPRVDAPAVATIGPKSADVKELPVAFADGSSVLVKPGANADLREIRHHGATLALERGTVDVHVVHFDDTRWDVLAGPFDVKVTGTRFDATWDPAAKRLTVAMKEGSVEVRGPCVSERLAAPSSRSFSCEGQGALAAPASTTMTTADLPNAPAPESTSQPTTHAPAPKAEETAAALFARADAARLAGDRATAQKLYTTVRERHPKSAEAAKAAFLLGRLAESSGAGDDAARWYATVTRESPQSPYAQDALGRSMELAQKRGDATRARALADEYLKKHPTGPHRAYATSILEAP